MLGDFIIISKNYEYIKSGLDSGYPYLTVQVHYDGWPPFNALVNTGCVLAGVNYGSSGRVDPAGNNILNNSGY